MKKIRYLDTIDILQKKIPCIELDLECEIFNSDSVSKGTHRPYELNYSIRYLLMSQISQPVLNVTNIFNNFNNFFII